MTKVTPFEEAIISLMRISLSKGILKLVIMYTGVRADPRGVRFRVKKKWLKNFPHFFR